AAPTRRACPGARAPRCASHLSRRSPPRSRHSDLQPQLTAETPPQPLASGRYCRGTRTILEQSRTATPCTIDSYWTLADYFMGGRSKLRPYGQADCITLSPGTLTCP